MTARSAGWSLPVLRARSQNDQALWLPRRCASLRAEHRKLAEASPLSRVSRPVNHHHSLTAGGPWRPSESQLRSSLTIKGQTTGCRKTVPTKAAQEKAPFDKRSPLRLAPLWSPQLSSSSRSPSPSVCESLLRRRCQCQMSRASPHHGRFLLKLLLRILHPGSRLCRPCPSGSAMLLSSRPSMLYSRSGRTYGRSSRSEIVPNWLPVLYSTGACSWSRGTCISSRLWRTTRRCTNSGPDTMDRSRWQQVLKAAK
mmetsp:Transcript_15667/g.37752  ORF Transcript_15667/g.37752 Transcript_15667/m.37752 type:complete len:254 (-) Transcript_15667:117-878(-)